MRPDRAKRNSHIRPFSKLSIAGGILGILMALFFTWLAINKAGEHASGGIAPSIGQVDEIPLASKESTALTRKPAAEENNRSSQEVPDQDKAAIPEGAFGTGKEAVGDFLKDYWGDEWPGIRARIEEEGLPLDGEIDLSTTSNEKLALETISKNFLLDEDGLKKKEADLLRIAAVGKSLDQVMQLV